MFTAGLSFILGARRPIQSRRKSVVSVVNTRAALLPWSKVCCLLLILVVSPWRSAHAVQVNIDELLSGSSSARYNLQSLVNYDVIAASDLNHRIVKRGTTNSTVSHDHHKYDRLKEIKFTALGREFRLILNEKRRIISSHFKVFSIKADGRKVPYSPLDSSEFYEGRLYASTKSAVSAHIDSSTGLLTASIHDRDNDEQYIVEPLWRYEKNDSPSRYNESGARTMVVYRTKDVDHSSNGIPHRSSDNYKKSSYCDYIKVDDYVPFDENLANRAGREVFSSRAKRNVFYGDVVIEAQPFVATRCSLLLVADYLFYVNMGGSDTKQTINFLISLIDRVNQMFLDTDWSDEEEDGKLTGLGFVVHEIFVHDEPNKEINHFNNDQRKWNVRDLLEVFSDNPAYRYHCLAHLFTHRKFDNAVLGLAYVASPRKHSVGGICSHGYHKGNQTLYFNTGLTTTRNTFGQSLITRVADLVTAHELGHNWGAEHDPDISECSPNSKGGGAYIMFTYSVSGYDGNNKMFSPCSKRSMRAVLLAKSQTCFKREARSFCGNGIVEEGEECDAGHIDQSDRDPCCDIECRLKPQADCCDKNSPCCNLCRIMPLGAKCRDENLLACKRESYCDGSSSDCPPEEPVENGFDCLDRGKCKDGQCLPFCETLGMQSCMCDLPQNACYRCCRKVSTYINGTCEQFSPREVLSDGTPCRYGFCEKGRCEKATQDVVQRFWDVIEEIDGNTFLKFMKDNIVGVVLVLLAAFWIPGAIYIKRYDNELREAAKKAREPSRERPLLPPHVQRPSAPAPRPSASSHQSAASFGHASPPKHGRSEFGKKMPRNPLQRRAQLLHSQPPQNGSGDGPHRAYNLRPRHNSDSYEDEAAGFTARQRFFQPPAAPGQVSYDIQYGLNMQPHGRVNHHRLDAPVAFPEEDDVDTENSTNEATIKISELKGFNI